MGCSEPSAETKRQCAEAVFTTSVPRFPSLGEINDKGEIYTTCGWSAYGPAWVLKKQIPPAVGYGWQQTGKTAEFQRATLFELVRGGLSSGQ